MKIIEAGFNNLDNYLARYDKIVISTHESPDADGLGAEIAFNELLHMLGKKSIIINSDHTPETVQFIDIDGEINIFNENFSLPEDIREYAQIVLDTNDYNNIGQAYHTLKDLVIDTFIIDHHEGDRNKFETNFVKVDASSCCEIVYDIIMYYEKPLTFKAAQAIYTGMLFDTGSFRYPKTSAWTYSIAAHCKELGADPFRIYEYLYEKNSLSSFSLRSRILSSMEVMQNGRLIIMKLTPEMLRSTGASFSEGEPAINLPLTVRDVVASVLVKQDIVGPVKVSMRTKGDLDVAAIAMKNGGGGHKNAAGFKSKVSFDETYSLITEIMDRMFRESEMKKG
jgi:phosphoesterase RecJ-like protein